MTDSSDTDATEPPYAAIQHHSDPALLQGRLEAWLARQLPDGASPSIGEFTANDTNGMSSDTVLCSATWSVDGVAHHERFVVRIAPDADAFPVFPTYDLAAQFATMRHVSLASSVPVPQVWWCEPDTAPLGRPFFVMSRVDGDVPPDMLPYTFGDNWVGDLDDATRRRLQDEMVRVLADLHAIADPAARFAFLADPAAGGPHDLARHVAATERWYEWSLATNPRSTLVERAFTLLHDRLPANPGPTVLSWGDARIGNVLFDGPKPVAVLDWEMAGLGPRELDVTWLTYSHRVFQDLAEGLELPGLPAFLGCADVCTAYETASGHRVQDLEWHLLYAAVRWALAFLRTGARQASLTGAPLPEDGDELLHNRPSLSQLVTDTFVP